LRLNNHLVSSTKRFLQQAKILLLPNIGTPRVGVDLQAFNPSVETN
jgi:hypothetical protein